MNLFVESTGTTIEPVDVTENEFCVGDQLLLNAVATSTVETPGTVAFVQTSRPVLLNVVMLGAA